MPYLTVTPGTYFMSQILTENKAEELYKFLQEQTGLEYKDPDDVQSLYSTLKAEEDFNLSLPEWTRGVYPDQLVPLTVFSYMLNAYNTQLQKLKAGPLLKKIIGDTDAKISGESRKTMYMYSGHDSTISNILLALGVWEPQLPVYNIMVLIELHRTLDSGYGVKVFLRNTTAVPPHLLTIPGCEQLCPYDKFLQLTSQVVPTDLDTACKVDNPDFVVPIAATP
ncbi:unnamed protein product [Timema podura]|uniref:Prostatic acid phosphatase n=1 Tax=Timema podura TaxID=61482 RepID=A0ABN7PEA7_TIMPD|nr:unnamed protein product [Timema podura]